MNYVLSEGLEDKLPPAIAATYLAIIPYMAKFDESWSQVTEDNFVPGRFEAQMTFVNTVKNLLASKSLLK